MKSLIAENEIKKKKVLFCFSMPTGALQLPLSQKKFYCSCLEENLLMN